MAKIAGESYPADLDPEEAERWADILVNQYGGEAESKEAFAQDVGHKSTSSGTFKRKVADARKYGIFTSRGTYEATELGFRLANPEDKQERHEVIREMLLNISLLANVHDTLNGSETPNEFWRVLTELTDANPKEAREAEGWLEMLYEELLNAENHLSNNEDSHANQVDDSGSSEPTETARVNRQRAQVEETSPSESGIYIKVGNDELRFEEVTDVNIELCQHFLESKKDEESDDGSVQMRLG